MTMEAPGRIGWAELPPSVREFTEDLLGGSVVESASQAGGYSPGSADRIRTAGGRRAFAKAVSRSRNEFAYPFHRREARVLGLLPASLPAPRLLGAYDDGEWVALVIEDVEGRHPGTSRDDVVTVLDALSGLPLAHTVGDSMPALRDDYASYASGWSELRHDGRLDVLPAVGREHLEEIERLTLAGPEAVDGEYLQHLDLRGDNVLLDGAGRAWILDWPHAGIGARWFDGVTLLLDTRLRGGDRDLEALVGTHPLFSGAAADDVDAALAGLMAYFFNSSRRPAPANMPTLRAFQLAQGVEALGWLASRRGWDLPSAERRDGGSAGA